MGLSSKLRFEVFERDAFTCQYCGRKTPEVILEVDHVMPVSQGGNDDIDNLTTSCFECNRGKGATVYDSITIGKDIHAETVLLAEREMQRQEYTQLKEKIRQRENNELGFLKEQFANQFHSPRAENSFPETFIRHALKFLTYIDILGFIEYAIEKTRNDRRGLTHYDAAARYFGGIIKNKIREMDKREGCDNG